MSGKQRETLAARRARLALIVEVGASDDLVSRGYDFWITGMIVLNLTATVLNTFSGVRARCGALLDAAEMLTVICFALDYLLRLLAARFIYPGGSEARSLCRYVFSVSGLIDLLSFLPAWLPVFFPEGAVAFRIFRIIRIFRLFRINAYYDSLNAITEVLRKKKQQLISSVLIVLVLMLAASLCMYSVENAAQPEVFSNAFSGIWWAASTLLTVGYGDIYPVTALGKALSIVITFLGVGMVAIPTGIISAGFVEQYGLMQRSDSPLHDRALQAVQLRLGERDPWVGQAISALHLPASLRLAAVHRGREVLLPRPDTVLAPRDLLVLAAPADSAVELKEVKLAPDHPWCGQYVRDLDLSRQTLIVMIRREERIVFPGGDTRLKAGDLLLLHTRFRKPKETPKTI